MTSLSYHVWGEGPDDAGRDSSFEVEQGCYDVLVQRAAPRGTRLTKKRSGYLRNLRRLPGPRRYKQKGLHGFALQAYLATREASTDGIDMVVIGTDTDQESGRASKAVCRRKRAELQRGHAKASADCAEVPPRFVCIVPLRKLEAWLLADAKGFKRVTGRPLGALPKPPEALAGSTDAKKILAERGGSEFKLALAMAARPETLTQACPVSYPPFREDVQRAITQRP